mgnify:CR=1 FL=1
MTILTFSPLDLTLVALIFVWTGFVRSGLGFGGAALGLPLLFLIEPRALYWLPIIGSHLLFFSALTLRTRIHNVDWAYLRQVSVYVIPAALIGIFGLISLPNHWLVLFIYSITLFYAGLWLLNLNIHSNHRWLDRILLIIGGYVAGTSLSGAPIMVAVFMRHIARHQLRNTMFVLWFLLVTIKMLTFVSFKVPLHLLSALLLLPVATIGHVAGLRLHDRILQHDQQFKRLIGGVLALISLIGLWHWYRSGF